MSNKLKYFAVAMAAAGLMATGAHATNLLTDGSFESDANYQVSPNHAGDEQLTHGSTDLPGWTIVGNGKVGWFSPANPYQITASDGSYSLDLTGDTDNGADAGGVQQSVQTVVNALYTLTFDLGSDQQYGLPVGIKVTAGSATETFTSDAVNQDNTNANIWTPKTFTFTATGTTTVISLVGVQGRAYIGLDNVDLEGPPGAPAGGVPEPASWALMIMGFGGAGAMMRRKRMAGARLSA